MGSVNFVPAPGMVFETVNYRGHIYAITEVNLAAEKITFVLLSVCGQSTAEAYPGRVWDWTFSDLEWGLHSRQIERLA